MVNAAGAGGLDSLPAVGPTCDPGEALMAECRAMAERVRQGVAAPSSCAR